MPAILVADDEPLIREVIRALLTSAGHTVVSAKHGLEAAQILAKQRFDLLIADLLMPVRDGIEVIMDARAAYPDMRLIAMSGGGHIGARLYLQIASGLQVDATLVKPFTKDTLLGAVRAALESPRPAHASHPSAA